MDILISDNSILFKEQINRVRELLFSSKEQFPNQFYLGVPYNVFKTIQKEYDRVIDQMDLYLWSGNLPCDTKASTRISATYPPIVEGRLVIKLSAPFNETLLTSQQDISFETRSFILNNLFIKTRFEITLYYNFYFNVYKWDLMKHIDHFNAKCKNKVSYDKSVLYFDTNPYYSDLIRIIIPIKHKVDISDIISSIVSRNTSLISAIDISINRSINTTSRDSILNWMCDCSNDLYKANFDLIENNYAALYTKDVNFCVAEELIENNVDRLVLCENIIEFLKIGNRRKLQTFDMLQSGVIDPF
jgi:hypothetical protein